MPIHPWALVERSLIESELPEQFFKAKVIAILKRKAMPSDWAGDSPSW